MVFLGNISDDTSGFKKHKNTAGLTNAILLEKLSGISVSFGTPKMGTMMKKEAVVYEHVSDTWDVYVLANDKNVQIGRVYSQGVNAGLGALKEAGIMALTGSLAQNSATSAADRAVDELDEIIKKLLNGEEVTESNVSISTSSGNSIKLYMRQKVFTIRDKYSICDLDETPVYYVKGNITGLGFSIQYADGSDIMTIKKKLVAITPEYTLFEGNENIGHIKKKIKLGRAEIQGEVKGQPIMIKGDMVGHSFNIFLNGKAVGNVDTARLTWGDCYSIEVLDESVKDLVVTIAVICDNTLKGND